MVKAAFSVWLILCAVISKPSFFVQAELRICVLPTHLSYDAPWPVRKVPLRCTPHFATYHLESKTYCVVTSLAEPTNKYYKFNGEDKVTVFSAHSNLSTSFLPNPQCVDSFT